MFLRFLSAINLTFFTKKNDLLNLNKPPFLPNKLILPNTQMRLSYFFCPFELRSKQHEEWKYLQPAKKHIENKYDL